MFSKLGNLINKLNIWASSILISALLLATFMYLQKNNSSLLALSTKWLVVASVPLVIAILRSNIIQKFKGLGIELETKLQDPIGQISLAATAALQDLPGDEKQSYEYLVSMPPEKRLEVQRLSLIDGRKEYYSGSGVLRYIQELPRLRFLEVRNEDGRFVALLPVSLFVSQYSANHQRAEELVNAIEKGSVKATFGDSAITETVNYKEGLVEVLPKIRESRYGVLPVVSANGRLLGIITTEIIEKKISDAVIAVQKRGEGAEKRKS